MSVNQPSTEWVGIGERIRLAREGARLSVRELARRVDVSPSHVSQVERGLAQFSVRALYNVVSELGISMDGLFDDGVAALEELDPEDDPENPVPAAAPPVGDDPLADAHIVLRVAARPSLPLAGGTRWERLTPHRETGAEFIEVVYPPNEDASTVLPDFIRHSSREYGVVTQGSLHVQVGFDQAVLEVGDSMAFDSDVPHRFWNATPQEVRAIWFIWETPGAKDATPAWTGMTAH